MQENINSLNPMEPGKGETTTRPKQIKTIVHFLKKETSISSMAASLTGVPQKRITRYNRDPEKNGLQARLLKTPCQETGFKAYCLTTNPEKFPKSNQLKKF